MQAGIISYGAYFPSLRIRAGELAQAWGSSAGGWQEKTVLDYDEDTLTMAIEAAKTALSATGEPKAIDLLTWASTNPPYSEKVLTGTIAEMLNLSSGLLASEHNQSSRAGGEAVLVAAGLLRAGMARRALVLCADSPRANPRDSIEQALAAAGVAFVLGQDQPLATIEGFAAASQENLGERYRGQGQELRDIGVRTFTGQAYFQLGSRAIGELLQQLGRTPAQYQYLVLQEIDQRSPGKLAQKLGFSAEQLQAGRFYDQVGDCGAASALLGLAAVLDQAQPGSNILVLTYGSGAGALAFSLQVKRQASPRRTVRQQLEQKRAYLTYSRYLQVKKYL